MGSRFTQIVIALVIAFFGFIFISNKKDAQNTDAGVDKTSAHFLGNQRSGVTLREFGDFQCPACRAFHPIVKQIVEKYKDRISFQFSHYPLIQIHPNAFASSRAAEAAAKQDKFWEMHDMLYENQTAWASQTDPLSTFVSYAGQLGLDTGQFKTDYSSSEINDIVSGDFQIASASGATSTPTFVLNGEPLLQNPTSIEEFGQLIDAAIAGN